MEEACKGARDGQPLVKSYSFLPCFGCCLPSPQRKIGYELEPEVKTFWRGELSLFHGIMHTLLEATVLRIRFPSRMDVLQHPSRSSSNATQSRRNVSSSGSQLVFVLVQYMFP